MNRKHIRSLTLQFSHFTMMAGFLTWGGIMLWLFYPPGGAGATLADQNCLEPALTKKDSIGFRRTGSGWIVSIIPLRLTANGHQFAADLTKPTVIEQLRTSFSDAGPNEVVKIAFALSKQVLEKKLKQLTDL